MKVQSHSKHGNTKMCHSLANKSLIFWCQAHRALYHCLAELHPLSWHVLLIGVSIKAGLHTMKGIQGANLIASHFHKLASAASDMAAILQKNESLQTQLHALAGRVRSISRLIQNALADVKLEDWRVLRSDQPGAAAARTHLRSEQHACREALSKCLDASLSQLQRLDTSITHATSFFSEASSVLSPDHLADLGVFVRLWEFMTDTWRWSHIIVFAGMSQILGDPITVEPRCMDVLSWLLRLLRSQSAGLHALKAMEADEAVWLQGAICLLQPLISFLLHNRKLPVEALTRALAGLPDGVITIACCIASELSPPHLSRIDLPSAGPHSELITDIARGLDSVLLQCCDLPEPHPELITAATVEILKLGVFYSSTLPTERNDLISTYKAFSHVLRMLRMGEDYAVRRQLVIQEYAVKDGISSCSSSGCDPVIKGIGIFPTNSIPTHLVPRSSVSDLELMSVVCNQQSKTEADDVHPEFAKSVSTLLHVVASHMPGSLLGDQEAACMRELVLHSSFRVWWCMQQQLQQREHTQLLQRRVEQLDRLQQRVHQVQREHALWHPQCEVERQQDKLMLVETLEVLSHKLDLQTLEVQSLQDQQQHNRLFGQECLNVTHLQHLLLWLTEACTHSLDDDGEHGEHVGGRE